MLANKSLWLLVAAILVVGVGGAVLVYRFFHPTQSGNAPVANSAGKGVQEFLQVLLALPPRLSNLTAFLRHGASSAMRR